MEETKEEQERRIEYFKKKGNQQFTEDGRNAAITVDLVLQAKAKLSDNKVNGPEDTIVSEMIKKLPLEKIYNIPRCFQERFMGLMESPSSWKILKLVFLRKRDAVPKKEIRSCRAIALTSVMSKWYASCIILRLEREKEPEQWKNLHVGGVDGISCQHLQVIVTNLLQKQGEWQGERNPVLRHGTVVRLTMYLASLDIKTAFDEAKPKRLIAAPSACDKEGWKLHACGRKWHSDSGQCGRGRDEEKKADNFLIMSQSKEISEQMFRDLIEEANRWDLVPKQASLWWTCTYDSEKKIDMILGTTSGVCYESSRENARCY